MAPCGLARMLPNFSSAQHDQATLERSGSLDDCKKGMRAARPKDMTAAPAGGNVRPTPNTTMCSISRIKPRESAAHAKAMP